MNHELMVAVIVLAVLALTLAVADVIRRRIRTRTYQRTTNKRYSISETRSKNALKNLLEVMGQEEPSPSLALNYTWREIVDLLRSVFKKTYEYAPDGIYHTPHTFVWHVIAEAVLGKTPFKYNLTYLFEDRQDLRETLVHLVFVVFRHTAHSKEKTRQILLFARNVIGNEWSTSEDRRWPDFRPDNRSIYLSLLWSALRARKEKAEIDLSYLRRVESNPDPLIETELIRQIDASHLESEQVKKFITTAGPRDVLDLIIKGWEDVYSEKCSIHETAMYTLAMVSEVKDTLVSRRELLELCFAVHNDEVDAASRGGASACAGSGGGGVAPESSVA